MKWMMTTVLSILIGISLSIQTHANYQNFESMTIIDGTLLSDIEENDYQEALDKVSKRKFWGWKIHYIHERIKVSYIKETLFSFYNDGKTPFEYEYQATYDQTATFSISATGSIDYSNKDDAKQFKNKLDAALKISSDYKTSQSKKETIQLKIDVDPGTQVDLFIYGEGYITNGTAARYVFFFRTHHGGFEWFEVSTEYQRLEKIKI
ncbi:MAG: hypothetical protein ACPGJL_03410 [Acholeplasmataceae bacterium]